MRLNQIIDQNAFKAFKDSAKNHAGFTDSDGGVILARNLEYVDPTIFERKYPDLAFMSANVPADNSGGYARKLTSLRVEETGSFSEAGNKSDNKGKISLSAEDSSITVKEYSAESDWSDSQVQEANLQNINLPARFVAAHTKIYMREIDEAGLVGLGGGQGVLNYSGFALDTADQTLADASAQQMYDTFAALIDDQRNAVNNTPEYSADVVVTSTDAINRLGRTMMNTANGFATVLAALQANFSVRFLGSFRAKDIGASTTDVAVALSTSREVSAMRIPVPLKIGEVIKIGSFNFHVDSLYRIGGMDFLENAGGRRLQGL